MDQLDLFLTTPEVSVKLDAAKEAKVDYGRSVADKILSQYTAEKPSTHCDPAFERCVKNRLLIVLDMGANSATFFDGKISDSEIIELRTLTDLKGKELKDRKKGLLTPPKKGEPYLLEKYKLTHSELLRIPERFPNHCIVIENAHGAVPQGSLSLAQPFLEKELFAFYSLCKKKGCLLRFWPEKLTPKTLRKMGFIKDDFLDPIALWIFIHENVDRLNLKKPRSSFRLGKKREEAHAFVKESNGILNTLRTSKMRGEENVLSSFLIEIIPKIIHDTKFIDYDGKDYTEEVLDAFNLVSLEKFKEDQAHCKATGKTQHLTCSFYLKNTGDNKAGDLKLNSPCLSSAVLPSLLSCFLGKTEQDQDKRTTAKAHIRTIDGRQPSWAHAKEFILRLTPHHHKGGIARSNLTHWGSRIYVKRKYKEIYGGSLPKDIADFSKEQERFFIDYRKLYFHKIMKLMFNFLKTAVLEKYSYLK